MWRSPVAWNIFSFATGVLGGALISVAAASITGSGSFLVFGSGFAAMIGLGLIQWGNGQRKKSRET